MTAAKPPGYVEARLEVPRLQSDAVCNFITENFCVGLVLEEDEHSDRTRIIFYVPIGGRPGWKARLQRYLAHLPDGAPAAVPAIQERLIDNVEWVEQYRRSVEPVLVGGDVVIRCPWHPPPPPGTYDVIIEPRMAFGTGTHETTRSCLKIVRERFRPGTRFLDVGCGSGVLSILAAKMKAAFVKAVDSDATAVDNCRENFAVNRVECPAEVLVGSLELCRGDPPYGFVCANIIKKTILALLPDLKALTAGDGIMVLSGLLEEDAVDVSSGLIRLGLAGFEVHRDNEWLTFTVRR